MVSAAEMGARRSTGTQQHPHQPWIKSRDTLDIYSRSTRAQQHHQQPWSKSRDTLDVDNQLCGCYLHIYVFKTHTIPIWVMFFPNIYYSIFVIVTVGPLLSVKQCCIVDTGGPSEADVKCHMYAQCTV